MKFQVGDKVVLDANPSIGGTIAARSNNTKNVSFTVIPKVVKAKKAKPKVPVVTVNFRRLIAVDIIRKQRGKFFTAIFTGKDGQKHTCNGRTGVVKYLKGAAQSQLPDDLLNAFNVHKMAYRNIFLDGISEIRAEGKVFTFDKEN